jgi:hypothetical protein
MSMTDADHDQSWWGRIFCLEGEWDDQDLLNRSSVLPRFSSC